jgi:hypothetical protein
LVFPLSSFLLLIFQHLVHHIFFFLQSFNIHQKCIYSSNQFNNFMVVLELLCIQLKKISLFL